MAKEEVFHPDKKVSTGAYSAGIKSGGFLFVSGQGPVDLATGQVVRGTIEDETRLTLAHLDKILQAGGCTRHDVVKCTCHLLDIDDFARFNAVYKEFFAGAPLPARTTVQSVLWGDIKVEVDCIAKLPE